MSNFIGATIQTGYWPILQREPQAPPGEINLCAGTYLLYCVIPEFWMDVNQVDFLWPRSEQMMNSGSGSGNVSGDYIIDAAVWGYDWKWGGSRSRLSFSGQTLDSNGNPLANCVVKLFRTLDDSVQYQTVSDGQGNFTVYTPFAGNHYITYYKATAPDVAGMSVNTLVGSA
jgi:hypothetical protein